MSWFDDDDPDAPRARDWELSDPFRIPHVSRPRPRADTSRRPDTVIPLSEILDPLPPPARPHRVPVPAPEVTPSFELAVLTDDGEPVADVGLHVTDEFDHAYDLTTDATGRAACDLAIDATHSIRLSEPIDLSKVARAKEPVSPASTLRLDPHDTTAYRVGISKPVTIVLERPKATIVSLDDWREGQAVLVFGTARDREGGATTVRAILRTALTQSAGQLLVVGHADTKGGADDNDALAAERATSVALYLSGDRDAWAQHAYDHANMTALKAALAWTARAFGIDCDPGPVGPGWNPATAAALTVLRLGAGMDPEAKYGPDDWAAIYDLYDAELAAILYTDPAGLTVREQSLRLSDDDCGERWPVDAPDLDEHDSPENRRVDLVLVADGHAPRASVDEIYDGTFTCVHLAVAPEAKVRLRTVTTTLAAIGEMKVTVQIGAVLAELVADEFGLVEFTALKGEPITVLACTDLWAASRLVWGAYADMAALEGAGSRK